MGVGRRCCNSSILEPVRTLVFQSVAPPDSKNTVRDRYFDDPRTGPARAVVFTVDSSTPTRFAEAEEVLRQTLKPGVLPDAATTVVLCFTKVDVAANDGEGIEHRARLQDAIHEWCKRDNSGRRRVLETAVSVRGPAGLDAARSTLQWLKDKTA